MIDELVDELTITPAVGTTIETLSAFMSRMGAVVDGLGARNIGEIRALLGTKVGTAANNSTSAFGLLSGLSLASGGAHFAEMPRLTDPNFVRGSAHLEETGGTGNATSDSPVIFTKIGAGLNLRRLVVPIWRRAQMLRDTGVGQLSGVVRYTVAMYAAVEITAEDQHRLGHIHTA